LCARGLSKVKDPEKESKGVSCFERMSREWLKSCDEEMDGVEIGEHSLGGPGEMCVCNL
jgi:hypothetical protein